MAVLARITEGLAYLHALGVRHGDPLRDGPLDVGPFLGLDLHL